MIAGLLVTLAVWLLLYGINVPLRWLLVRRHRARHDVVLESWLKYPAPRVQWTRLLFIFVWMIGLVASTGKMSFTIGVMIGMILCIIAWPFYVRSKACTLTLLVFDRKGLSVFPVRYGLVGQGTFRTRLNWVDCFGYSYYKGHLLFALRTGGQIEQETGNRLIIGETLHRLGIRKLRMYDILERDAENRERNKQMYEAEFKQLMAQVESMVQDIVDSYQMDAAELGLHLQAEFKQEDDSEAQDEPYLYLHLSLRNEEEEVDALDWMIWAKYK
ncbi:MAG: hypothetical protein ACXVP2_05820 [Tumebacillaceae bacterium]